jgi:hypothetical protein
MVCASMVSCDVINLTVEVFYRHTETKANQGKHSEFTHLCKEKTRPHRVTWPGECNGEVKTNAPQTLGPSSASMRSHKQVLFGSHSLI